MTGEGIRRVVLLMGSEADAPQGVGLGTEATPLADILGGTSIPPGLDLRTISLDVTRPFPGFAGHIRLDSTRGAPIDRVLRALGGFALRERLASFPIGRLLNSIGPVAPNRVFWRTLRRYPDAMRTLRAADVVVAGDLETTQAAWVAVRRGWVREAYYDHRAVALALTIES